MVGIAGCAPDRERPPPGALSFDAQVTFDGSFEPDADPGELQALGGVIVGHVLGPSIVAREEPSVDSAPVAELDNPTEVGGPLVFQLVAEEVTGLSADAWVEVHLPVRPNGTTGWVRLDELALSRNPFRIEIDTGDHLLEVWRGDRRWLSTTVAIGTGATPTPIGEFYIIELLQPPVPDGLYGPFAFGLSGFSETLQSFAGGDGVIGIHGTDEPDALGTDVSHGCVRVRNDVITELAGVIPLGTPVVITT
ncbi:MAG: L,D-transpeptidase family protein [Actinomycetota bacterium]